MNIGIMSWMRCETACTPLFDSVFVHYAAENVGEAVPMSCIQQVMTQFNISSFGNSSFLSINANAVNPQ